MLGKDGDGELGILEVQPGKPVAPWEEVPEEVCTFYFEMAVNNECIQVAQVDNCAEFPGHLAHQKDITDKEWGGGRSLLYGALGEKGA